jgi:hypothetical protein
MFKKHKMEVETIVILGITSSLGAELLKYLPQNRQYIVPVRTNPAEIPTDSKKAKYREKLRSYQFLKFVEYNGSEEAIIDILKGTHVVINLTTEDFLGVLIYCKSVGIRTMSISSGAVTDWVLKRPGFVISELAQNENTREIAKYIEKKLLVEAWSTFSIRPGYYLPSADSTDTGSGLHIQTGNTIFSENGSFSKDADWDKRKYVTPIGLLAKMIASWSLNINDFGKSKGVYCVGSTKPYTRWELREMAGLPVSETIKSKFPIIPHDEPYKQLMEITTKELGDITFDIKLCCQAARLYFSKY